MIVEGLTAASVATTAVTIVETVAPVAIQAAEVLAEKAAVEVAGKATEVVSKMAMEVGTDAIKDMAKEVGSNAIDYMAHEVAPKAIESVKNSVTEKIQDLPQEIGTKIKDEVLPNLMESDKRNFKEINEKQNAAIKEAFERIKNGKELTSQELGNLCEMMMDQFYISEGYTPLNKHRVTSLDDKKEGFTKGIDGVYEKTNPDGSKSYAIADAKYNTSRLSETNDGKQMSDKWIDKRLDDAVGKEKADEIRDAAENNPDSVKKEVYHVDPSEDINGNIHSDIQEVDSEGNKLGDKKVVETFDKDGNRTDPSPKG